jgi:hypothetical protein
MEAEQGEKTGIFRWLMRLLQPEIVGGSFADMTSLGFSHSNKA